MFLMGASPQCAEWKLPPNFELRKPRKLIMFGKNEHVHPSPSSRSSAAVFLVANSNINMVLVQCAADDLFCFCCLRGVALRVSSPFVFCSCQSVLLFSSHLLYRKIPPWKASAA